MHWWLPEISIGERILRSLIVLVILSNALENAMTGPDKTIPGGLIGAATVLAANWIVGRMALSSARMERAFEGVPALFVHHGQSIERTLRRETISREELLSNLRSQEVFNQKKVRAAVLEPSCKLSVLKKQELRSVEARAKETERPPESFL
jgi:uncharacterized membrane protein YcaP (DUF421 family)